MQVPQADLSQSKRVGVDERFIKFIPSSNFKGMKKFIRSKIDKTETSNRSSPNNLPDPPPPPNLEPSDKNKPDLQPAPDTLESTTDATSNNTEVKNENYRSPNKVESETFTPQEEVKRSENNAEDVKPPESTIMCRDFIRGTCKRPGTCRYAHKCDKTQLFGVYTFCRNFQNKICTLPNCKYVHASVFEEQEFYRTGKLPPHVLAPKCLPPPPPPPPGEPGQSGQPGQPGQPEGRVEIPTSFSNPPPVLPPSVQASSSMFACLPTNASEPRTFQEEFGSTRDGYGESSLSKCKCNTIGLRLRCHLDLLEKKREAMEEWKRKTSEMDSKKEKLIVILMGLFKLANTTTPSTGPSSLFNITGGDKHKMMLEQLVNLNSNNRMTVGVNSGDNSSASLLGENFSITAIVAKLLSEHQSHSADAGRRE